MKHNPRISAAITAILSASAAQAVLAQAVGPAAPPQTAQQAAAPEGGVQEVVVTAERRTENIQAVPITIQALTGNTLSELNVSTADETFRYLPNVTTGNNGPGQSNIFMRGLALGTPGTQSSGTIGIFPNVAVYLDEQSTQLPSHNIDIYAADLERIEVLEGPQGTLFGGGSEAGVIRYITNKPKLNRFEGTADAEYSVTAGGDPNTAANAVFNIPILQDKMAFRAVFYTDNRGGYIDNVASTFTRQSTDVGIHYAGYATACSVGAPLNGACAAGKATAFGVPPGSPVINNQAQVQNNFNPVRYQGVRASLLTQFTDDWSLLISQMYQTLHSDGVFYALPKSSDGASLAPYQTTVFTPNYNNDFFENTAWTVNGKIWELNAIYTGAYLDRRIDTQNDYTNYARGVYADYYQCYKANAGQGLSSTCFSPVAFWHEHQTNTHMTHELRFSTPDDWRVRGILGGYWEQYRIADQTDWFYKTMPSCTASVTVGCLTNVAPVPTVLLTNPSIRPDNDAFNEDDHRGYTQTAFFLSGDFDIIPKVLTVSAGTRHYHYAINMEGSVQSSFGCYEAGPPPCYGSIISDPTIPGSMGLASSYSGFKSRANITWHITPDIMAYATWSQGFRPGGFNRNTAGILPDANGFAQYIKPLAYAPDNLTNYEGGIKTEFLDHHILLNASYYYEKWENAQLQLFNPAEFGNLTFAVNGPDYRVRGFEVQLTAIPFEGLSITGSGSWNQAQQSNSPLLIDNNCGQLPGTPANPNCGQPITTYVAPGGAIASALNPFGASGGAMAFSPPAEWNLRARYDWSVTNNYLPFVQIGVTHTDHYYNTVSTAPNGDLVSQVTTTFLRYEIPGYTVWDAAAGINKDNWQVQIFGQNITNNDSNTFISSGQFIKAEFPLRPRIIGVRANVKF